MSDSFNFDLAALQQAYDELDPEKQEQVRKDHLRDKRRQAALKMQSDLDLKHLMTLAPFRRFMFTVLARSGMYQAAFHPHDGALREANGRRGLGIELLNDLLRQDPEFALDMTREQAKLEQKVNDARTD